MFSAKVIADSIGSHGVRATTIEATYPRFIHSEVLTHRDRARNSASSRAIPWKVKAKDLKTLQEIDVIKGVPIAPSGPKYHYVPKCMYSMIQRGPVIPLSFDAEQRGMQSGDAVPDQERCREIWLDARNKALAAADSLASMGVHKSLVNRIVEPWMWITVVMTATTWKNFFRLRIHRSAEKHFNRIATMIRDAIDSSEPRLLKVGEWHLPYIDSIDKDLNIDLLKQISAGRCARVSYLTHDGKRDPMADIKLFEKLINSGDGVMHASPLEHQLECLEDGQARCGCFKGWKSFRSEFADEYVL